MSGSADALLRDFRARRWLIVVLRAAHLVGVVGVGAGMLGPGTADTGGPFACVLVASGLAMIAIDLWSRPACLGEVAGLALLVKLGLLAWLVADAPHRVALFWIVLVVSALIAHAPARLRHRRMSRGKCKDREDQ